MNGFVGVGGVVRGSSLNFDHSIDPAQYGSIIDCGYAATVSTCTCTGTVLVQDEEEEEEDEEKVTDGPIHRSLFVLRYIIEQFYNAVTIICKDLNVAGKDRRARAWSSFDYRTVRKQCSMFHSNRYEI